MGNNTKKVAKNALFLYLRSGVSLIVQFIAIRYLLKNLGVDGYGLYGLIGSIVGLVESFKGLLSGSIQRFINIEIGNNNDTKINEIFNVGLRIQLKIATILVSGIIIIGLIAIPYLNIPTFYSTQAYYVLILSSITMGISILGVPYDAIITAYERFNLYAYNSICTSILKLLIALSLVFFPIYTVTVYALLLLCVTVITNVVNILYCKKEFSGHIEIKRFINKRYIKELTSFAGFKSLGTIGITLQNSGLNFILNIFGGLIVNTARTITYQVMTAVNTLTWNINIGFTPRCLTLWGAGQYKEFFKLLCLETKFCFSINSVLGSTIAAFSIPILKLWLGEVPEYASGFIRIIFLYSVLKSLQDIFDLIFSAHGIIKAYQICTFVINILSLGGMYLVLYLQSPLYSAFLVLVASQFLIIITCAFLSKFQLNFDVKDFFNKVLFRILISSIIQILLFKLISSHTTYIESIEMFILWIIPYFLVSALSTLIIVFQKNEFLSLIKMFKNIINGKKGH